MAVAGDKDVDIPRAGSARAARPGGPAAPRTAAPRPRGPGCRRSVELVVLLAPALLLFVGFVLLPIVLAAWYGMYNGPASGRWARSRACTTTGWCWPTRCSATRSCTT